MKKLSVYLARPMKGCKYQEVVDYYKNLKEIFDDFNIISHIPMAGEEKQDENGFLVPYNYVSEPKMVDSAIFGRDMWMVRNCDVVFANLLKSKDAISIGTTMEIGWGKLLGKHVIICMEKDNIHNHPFITQSADIIFEDEESAINYIVELNS